MKDSATIAHVVENTYFDRDTTGLRDADTTHIVDLANGARYAITAAPVRKAIGDAELRLLAYNGSVPGPTLRVRQGATVTIDFTNRTDLENTIHWHGVRLENAFDGTHETQAPVPVGGTFRYRVRFPDPGVYWYHPHVREDYAQEMGLSGTIVVVPADADYWGPAHREVPLTLDDILVEDGRVAPFDRSETTFAAMGRYGNVFLVNGEPDPTLTARHGEVVRFFLVNTANTRVFNVGFAGARMKLVGGDGGRCEREEFVDSVLLAPSERAVVEVLFDQPGHVSLEHRTPHRTRALAAIHVGADPAEPALAQAFGMLRRNPEWAAERARIARFVEAPPDKTLALVAEMDMGVPEGPIVYACPMHPDVVRDEPGRCPICGMALVATAAPSSYACPMHPEIVSDAPGHCPTCGMKLLPAAIVAQAPAHGTHAHHGGAHLPAHHADAADPGDQAHHHGQHGGTDHAGHHGVYHHSSATGGIEWDDDMVDVNRSTTPATMRWKLIDRATGAENRAIDWRFRVGDTVKLRIVNETDSDHPMNHPFHIHGAGRFVVLARAGAPESNLVWKDTVLVRTGETVDVLLDITNPGLWMAHCHIAEHHESGMMFSFRVDA